MPMIARARRQQQAATEMIPTPTPNIVYLAGPITNVPIAHARGWRKTAAEMILLGVPDRPVVVYDPAAAFSATTYHDPELEAVARTVNDLMITASNVVLVRFKEEIVSRGTDHEIALAIRLGKRIVVWRSENDAPFVGGWIMDAARETERILRRNAPTISSASTLESAVEGVIAWLEP